MRAGSGRTKEPPKQIQTENHCGMAIIFPFGVFIVTNGEYRVVGIPTFSTHKNLTGVDFKAVAFQIKLDFIRN
jgi:hypothetical protein